MRTLLSARTILLFLAVALLNIFFFRSWDGLGTAILVGLFYSLIVFTHWKELSFQGSKQWFLLSTVGIALSAAVLVLRANDFVQVIAFLTSWFLLAALWNSLEANQPGVHSFAELVMTPLTSLRNYFVGLTRFALSSKTVTQPSTTQMPISGQKIKSLIIGIIISIPIIAIVTTLLAAGDPIFQTALKDLFDFQLDIDEQIGQRILLTLLFLILLIPFLQRKLGVAFKSPVQGLSRFNFTTEFSVLSLLLTLLLGFFLAIQWQYIFVSVAAETDLSQFGVKTYSEYVTRGFVELQLVSIIIYSVVWLGLVLMRAHDTISAKRLKFIQLVLLAEFGIFLISLFRRVWLYQSLHGMTIIRAYGAFFVLGVSLFALTLAGRHLTTRSFRWVQLEIAILVGSVLLLSVFNVEHYLSVSHPPTVNNKVDYVYLSRLSPDGSAGWEKALAHAEETLNNPELDQTPLITRDQRREIAYAGTIVKTLQIQRYGLLKQYGTAQEMNQFFLASLEHTDNRYTNRIEPLLEVGPSATASTMLSNREKVRQVKTSIQGLTDTAPLYLNYYMSNLLYSGNNQCRETYCFLAFFDWENYELKHEPADTIERKLQYNASAYTQYLQRDTTLPMNQLVELEDRFFELQNKVNQQPQEEQEFDVDINMYSPLVNNI